MKEFFKTKGAKVLVPLLAVLIIALLTTIFGGGRSNIFTDITNTLTSPLKQGLNYVADYLEGVYGYMYDYDRLKAENAQMRSYIAEMEAEERRWRETNDENDRLHKLLEIKNHRPEFQFQPASVISWNTSSWSSGFTINRGTTAGVSVGDCVITEDNFLVGQVIEAGTTTAVVRTLIDVDMSVGAIIDRNGIAAIASGDFTLMKEGTLRLGFVPGDVVLLNGDTLLTSGKGEVFPEGIVIGKIVSAQLDESGERWYGVKPSVGLDTLTQVFVITDIIYS